MVKKLVQLTIAILTFIAFSNIATATGFVGYQPDIPQDLIN